MRIVTAAVTTCLFLGLLFVISPSVAKGLADEVAVKPVDSSMHEFMEYYFQPTYRRLKANMNASKKAGSHWKAIKADAMILAEGGNLLLTRKAPKAMAAWQEHSVSIRQLGGQLYRAAKKKDGFGADRLYRAMLTSCNQCHTKFAGGKHQLKP